MPSHPFYTPDEDFVAAHSLSIEEGERWVTLYKSAGPDSDYLAFDKQSGNIVFARFSEWADEGGAIFTNLFDGYLPSKEAFDNLLTYTRWL